MAVSQFRLAPQIHLAGYQLTKPLKKLPIRTNRQAGGTKGFSLNPGAVSRFYLTAEYRSTCVRNLREMVEHKTPGVIIHADLEPSRIKSDEKDIKSLLQLVETSWVNPFSKPNELVCL